MDAKKLIEAIEAADVRGCDEELVARWYSGRGMRGASCVGVTVPRGVSAFQLGAAVAVSLLDGAVDDEGPDDVEALARLRVGEDAMGLDGIVYFPDVPWPEEEEEDEPLSSTG